VTDGPTLRAAAGSVLYLALIALLSLGTATAVRDSATAIGIVLGLLYLFPIIAQLVTDPHWQRHLQQLGPMTAGLTIQATTTCAACPSAHGQAWARSPHGHSGAADRRAAAAAARRVSAPQAQVTSSTSPAATRAWSPNSKSTSWPTSRTPAS
jgi:hypothetical protein